MKKIKVIFVDDHPIILKGLDAVFKNDDEIEVLGFATRGEEALSLLRVMNPDVVVLDISMPGIGGVETTKQILNLYPEISILIFSMHGEYSFVKLIRELGVHGFILKDSGFLELKNAIKTLAEGREYFSREVNLIARSASRSQSNATEIKFTKRETEVLNGLAHGWDNTEIADRIIANVATVESHLKSIRAKTGLSSARALVRFAIENGFGGE